MDMEYKFSLDKYRQGLSLKEFQDDLNWLLLDIGEPVDITYDSEESCLWLTIKEPDPYKLNLDSLNGLSLSLFQKELKEFIDHIPKNREEKITVGFTVLGDSITLSVYPQSCKK